MRGCAPQHARMSTTLRTLLQPLPLAGLATLAAVALSLRYVAPPHLPATAALLALYALIFIALQLLPGHWRMPIGICLLLMPVLALVLSTLMPRVGTAQVLLVIWVACAFGVWPLRHALPLVLLVNAGFYLLLRRAGFGDPLILVLINLGFQALAGICVHYATAAERSRDALARVNADLLATRALLADSARDAERLRLARELHDVAGHKLTAMRINLRLLAADPALAGHPSLAVTERLSGELLGDIRQVVQSLRDDRGLDLETALRALAAPFPRPALELHLAEDVRVADANVAEALLRLVQEALTNAARHADAGVVQVRLRNEDGHLRIDIEDDGRRAGDIREGNGIAGMRERLGALHGTLELGHGARGGMRLSARLPA